MEDGDSIVQLNRDSGARSFAYDPAKPHEHELHIPPTNGAGRMGEGLLDVLRWRRFIR